MQLGNLIFQTETGAYNMDSYSLLLFGFAPSGDRTTPVFWGEGT